MRLECGRVPQRLGAAESVEGQTGSSAGREIQARAVLPHDRARFRQCCNSDLADLHEYTGIAGTEATAMHKCRPDQGFRLA
jgi:hypothetical protein